MRKFMCIAKSLRIMLLAMFAFAAFSLPQAEAGQTMTIWIRSDGSFFMPPLVDLFNKTHENQINLELVLPQELVRKFATAFAAGEAPDALSLDLIYNPQFIKADMLEDITDFAKGLPYFGSLSKAHVKLASKGGRIYGLPMAAEASFLMYNKNLFRRAGLDPEKPPTNFAEFEDIAVKISEIGDEYYGYFVSTAGGGNCSFTFTPLIWATGGNILNDDGSKVTMTDPAVKEALAFYRRLFRRGAMPETCQSDAGANRIPIFASGRIGIIPGGTFNAAFIIKNHPEIELGTTPIPGKNGGIGTFSGGDNFVIPKGTKKLAVAKEFIEWVYTLEGQTILAEYGSLPPRLDIAAEALKDKHPLYQMAARLLEIGQTPYNDRYMELFNSNNSPWVEMIQRATFTDESIDVITRETEEFIQNVIDQD